MFDRATRKKPLSKPSSAKCKLEAPKDAEDEARDTCVIC